MKTRISFTLSVLLLFATGASSAIAAEHRKEVEKDALDGQVTLTTVLGDITVEGTDGQVIVLVTEEDERQHEARKVPEGMRSLFSGGDGNTGSVEFKQDGKNFVLVPTDPHAMGDMVLRVPRTMSVRLPATVRGDVQVHGVLGELEIVAAEGDIEIDDASGPVVVQAVNGDVDIVFAKYPATSPSSINSVNGTVTVTLPSDAAATLDLETINGDVFSDLAIEVSERRTPKWGGPRSIKGTLNGGGAALRIQSINDSIMLRGVKTSPAGVEKKK